MFRYCSKVVSLPNFLIPFVVKNGVNVLLLKNLISIKRSQFFILYFEGPNFASIYKNGNKVSPIIGMGTGLWFACQKGGIERFVVVGYSLLDCGQP